MPQLRGDRRLVELAGGDPGDQLAPFVKRRLPGVHHEPLPAQRLDRHLGPPRRHRDDRGPATETPRREHRARGRRRRDHEVRPGRPRGIGGGWAKR